MMTAEQLKGSILQLAMQGKLVEQRPEEGTGEDLYKEIQIEKKRLIREGKVKKKLLSDNEKDDIPFDIPVSWRWVRISEISTVINGDRGKNYPSKSTLSREGIPFISALNLDGRTVVKDDSLLCVSQEQYDRLGSGKLEKGDIVVCIRGSLGKHGRYPFEKGAIASSLVICRQFIKSEAMALFIMSFLDAPLFFDQIKQYDNGTAQPNLAAKSLEQFYIPLPPLAEQKRIVAKIEELMPFVEQYAATSTKLNTLNATFPEMMKKSILQEAVQGKLVSQDPNDEPASLLLKKIAEEKKRLIKEGKIKKENELPLITEKEIPFDIPESWEWARLGSLITVRGGKRLPVGKQLITEKTGHVYIRVTDMKNETVDMTDLHYLAEDVYKLISSYIIKKEDIFIVIVGSTIGKAGIIPDELDGMNLTENAARLTPYFVDKRFLLKMITSDFMQAQFVDRTHQVGQPKLALFRLKEAIIPIPPLNEQKRIVERLERFEPEILSLKNNLFR